MNTYVHSLKIMNTPGTEPWYQCKVCMKWFHSVMSSHYEPCTKEVRRSA